MLSIIKKITYSRKNFVTKMENTTTRSHTKDTAEQPYYNLNNGLRMPMVGYGTFSYKDANIIVNAIENGYRHLDSASYYKNEEVVGEAIKIVLEKGEIKREDLYIVTKVWMDEVEDVEAACKRSLAKLGITYADMYLLHWPVAVKRIQAPSE